MKRYNDRSEKEVDYIVDMYKKYNLGLITPKKLKDIQVGEFFSAELPPTSMNTYMRPGKGNEKLIPAYDSAGCPLLFTGVDELVYPLPKEIGERLFAPREEHHN